MADLPSGTVTFLFTDIEGSTRLLARLRDRYADVLAAHHRLLRAALRKGEYIGLDVHRAARICSAGHGGQVLISGSTYELVSGDLPPGVGLRDLGEHWLK